LTLTTLCGYTGPTAISNGTLLLSGTLSGSAVTVASGGTLAGNGNCGSTLSVLAGGTVSPGTSAGTLTVTNGVTLAGNALMEVHPALALNDLLRSINGNVTYGGTLTVTNIGGLFTNGSSFKLFNSGGGSYPGSFSPITLPGLSAGQSWNTSQLSVNGTISVVGSPAPPFISGVSASGGNLFISGGGGVTNGTYQLVATTNIVLGLTNWTLVGNGNFDGNGNFSTFVPINPATPQRFFAVRMP